MKIFRKKMKNESIEDPRELLLSLVDLGSIDVDEMLIACVTEMSDAECKRVLNSLSLPAGSEVVEEPEDTEDLEDETDEESDVEPVDTDDLEDIGGEVEDEAEPDVDDIAEVEARIRRLEKALKERCNKNEEDEDEDEEDNMAECNRRRAESRIRSRRSLRR